MCGRYGMHKNLSRKQIKELDEKIRQGVYKEESGWKARYNIAPTQYAPVKTEEGNEFRLLRWGLIPHWAEDEKIGNRMINARIESVTEKPAYRPYTKQRCLVPATSYYEWMKKGTGKQPYRIFREGDELFYMAGLRAKWKSPQNETIESYTILTQPPLERISHIHNRMPVLVAPTLTTDWLNDSVKPEEAVQLLQEEPFPQKELSLYPISTAINSPKNEGPEMIHRSTGQGEQGQLL